MDRVMSMACYRCLFSRPVLLGEPISGNVPQNYAENGLKNGAEEGYAAANGTTASPVGAVNTVNGKANPVPPSCSGVYSVSVPVPAVVRAIRTLSSPPFLRRGIQSSPSSSNKTNNDGFTLRLQLAAISVLKVLLSGDGADYMLRASVAMSADNGEGDEGGGDMEDSGED